MKYIFKHHEIFVIFLLVAMVIRIIQWTYRERLKDKDDPEVMDNSTHFNLSAAWGILWLVGIVGLFVSLEYDFVHAYALIACFVLVMGIIRLDIFWNLPKSDDPQFVLPWTSLAELAGTSIGIGLIEPWVTVVSNAAIITVAVLLWKHFRKNSHLK